MDAKQRKLSYLGQLIERLIWACPCESAALPSLGAAKKAMLSEALYFEKEAASQNANYANQIVPDTAQSAFQPNGSDSKDAARYRWLRDNNVGPSQIDRVCDDCNPPFFTLKSGDDLDAAIDAAILARGQACPR